MLGMAVGDSWGHLCEFMDYCKEEDDPLVGEFTEKPFNSRKVYNRFKLKAGQWTDDTSMALCLADSLIFKGKLDCVDLRARFILWWYAGYNNAFRFDVHN